MINNNIIINDFGVVIIFISIVVIVHINRVDIFNIRYNNVGIC